MSIFNYIGLIKSEVGQKMGKKECLVGEYFDLINTLSLRKEILSDT